MFLLLLRDGLRRVGGYMRGTQDGLGNRVPGLARGHACRLNGPEGRWHAAVLLLDHRARGPFPERALLGLRAQVARFPGQGLQRLIAVQGQRDRRA